MSTDVLARSLANILPFYYEREEDIRYVARAIGLDIRRANMTGESSNTWASVIEEARRKGKLQELIDIVCEEYPTIQDQLFQYIAATAKQPTFRVLGIWPDLPGMPPLDLKAERDGLYNSGIDYVALSGDKVTAKNVVDELNREHYTALEIGSHGDETGIVLSDGIQMPGWWSRIVRDRNLLFVVLMSCESTSVSDALVNAGIPAVVSVMRNIQDVAAVQFVQSLYKNLASGQPLERAVTQAKLTIDYQQAEMVRFRQVSG